MIKDLKIVIRFPRHINGMAYNARQASDHVST